MLNAGKKENRSRMMCKNMRGTMCRDMSQTACRCLLSPRSQPDRAVNNQIHV